MFWENPISAPPGIILCPGRLPASFISCWTWLYREEHVGVTGGRTERVKPGCSSLLAMRFISQGWSTYSDSLYLCSACRKLYCSFLCCILLLVVVVVFSFVLPSLSSVLLPMGFFCLSSCWMVWSPNLQGNALTHLRLKQLPRQEVQRAVHVCFGTGLKWKEAPILHLVLTNCHTLWFYCSGIFFCYFPFNQPLGNTS